KTIARGMPGDSGVTVVTNARVFYPPRAAAGAPGARHSLRPLFSGGKDSHSSGAIRVARRWTLACFAVWKIKSGNLRCGTPQQAACGTPFARSGMAWKKAAKEFLLFGPLAKARQPDWQANATG
ncbi:MAG: hypothetical protein ACLQDM_22445, partial [Bradyrhizobium sp.]